MLRLEGTAVCSGPTSGFHDQPPPPHWSHLRKANRCCAFKNDTWSPDSWFGQKPQKTDKNVDSMKATDTPGSYIHRMWRVLKRQHWFSMRFEERYPALGLSLLCQDHQPGYSNGYGVALWEQALSLPTHTQVSLTENKPQISSHLTWMRTQMREKRIYYNNTRNQAVS